MCECCTVQDPSPDIYQKQYRYKILRVRFRHSHETSESIVPEHSRGAALDKWDFGEVQQVRSSAGLEAVTHVLEDTLEHTPAHTVAELNRSGSEALARLG